MAAVAGLVLAAGEGRRFGGPKALARLPDGTVFLTRAVTTLNDGGCTPVVVVLGAAADEARPLAGEATLLENPDWPTGMGSSLRRGLAGLPPDANAVVVLLVDTPGIGAAAVRRLVALAGSDAVAVATYGGRRGHPVLLGRDHWAEVDRLAVGDEGARPFLRQYDAVTEIECGDVSRPDDVDTPADLERLSTGR